MPSKVTPNEYKPTSKIRIQCHALAIHSGSQNHLRVIILSYALPGPHKHCLTKQLKNNVHGASPNNLTNYACN